MSLYRDFYNCPIVNFCEWFYRWDGSDTELLNHRGGPDRMNRLTDRCRDAMLLADLDACTVGYSPINWQRSRIPNEYQHKLETIFDGIDTTFWRPLKWRERIPRRIAGKWLPRWKKVVTYVSRGFESMRGFNIFMQVAQRICEKRSDVVFLCIGSDRVCYGGDLKQIQEKSFREHVVKSGNYDLSRFIFTGPIPPAELGRAFAFSDLHIYLTVPFILSWSLMDALACGCTVLVADTPPLREVIEHGKNGLMAAYFDVDHFVELALEVLDDPAAYRRTLGQAGIETINERYDLDVVLPKMIDLYERAIALRGGGPALGAGLPTPAKHMTEGLQASSNGRQQSGRPPVGERGHDRRRRRGGHDLRRTWRVLRRRRNLPW